LCPLLPFVTEILYLCTRVLLLTHLVITIMTNLETLYSSLDGLKKVGLPLTEEQMALADELEEQLIKSEVLPTLSKDIEPSLTKIKRDLVLMVEYHPGEPISVALSRKAKISEIIGAKTLTPRNSMPVRSNEKPGEEVPHEPTKHIENVTKGMKVTFPDGTVIWHRQAIDTLIDSLQKIGFERVSAMGIEHGGGYNLVGKIQRPVEPGRIWQHECDGWYIYSNIGNKTKMEDLKRISDHYHLGLKIEEGKPE